MTSQFSDKEINSSLIIKPLTNVDNEDQTELERPHRRIEHFGTSDEENLSKSERCLTPISRRGLAHE